MIGFDLTCRVNSSGLSGINDGFAVACSTTTNKKSRLASEERMRRVFHFVVVLGALAVLAVGSHIVLTTVASGDSAWVAQARATCAMCHGE